MKKTLARLLSLALCVVMAVGFVPIAAHAEEAHSDEAVTEEAVKPDALLASEPYDGEGYDAHKCNGHHNWVEKGWIVTEEDSCFGVCEAFYKECTECQARWYIAFRKYKDNEFVPLKTEDEVGERHQYTETTFNEGCKENPLKEKHCTKCGHTIVEGGEHDWEEDGEVIPGEICTDYYTQQYKCKKCGETKLESTGERGTHVLEDVKVDATCTDYGYTYKKCKNCDYQTSRVRTESPLGHQWDTDVKDCTQERHCSQCGTTVEAGEHSFAGKWYSDDNGHWQYCSECGKKSEVRAHVYENGVCIVCGHYNAQAICKHTSWTYKQDGIGTTTHTKTCTECGYSVREACTESTADYSSREYCTDPLYCWCGRKINDGQKRHNFGTWICHDDTHEHRCLNRNCQYGVVEHHNIVYVKGVARCSVCSYVDKSLSIPHTHSFGAWTAGSNGCVQRCTDPTCDAMNTAAHKLGAADCTGNAVCQTCGATVKTDAGSIHTGGTELRGYVAPEVGKAGYTGDTYCLSCDKIVEKGSVIEALPESHVHEFTILKHDATGHWMECSCGEHDGAAVKHTGGTATCVSQAVCAVCGESYGSLDASRHTGGTELLKAFPAEVGKAGYSGDIHCLGCGAILERGSAIPALTPAHTHSYVLKYDSTQHWLECSCGDRTNAAEHRYVNGRCTECGDDEPAKVEAHVHTYSAKWSANSVAHWHTCTSCGTEVDMVVHVFINGKCADCGMTELANKYLAENEIAPKADVEQVFPDIVDDPASYYYTDAIQKLYDANIMSGTTDIDGEYIFDVDSDISNIETLLILARISGVDGTYDEWEKAKTAVNAWAKSKGLAGGADDEAITRQEMFYKLWVLAGEPESSQDLSGFADADKIDARYLTAIKWTVEKGVVTGGEHFDGKLYIEPNSEILRKDAATVVARYVDIANILI